ncbi:MAG: hypothetical protein ACI8P0_000995 [Planctomycetaceae bacterium]|jgi:hypothetical protein
MHVNPRGFVDALSQLLSDPRLRQRFENDRCAVINELGVSNEDAELLRQLDSPKLQQQAQGLMHKRQSEVARLMPITWERLSDDARKLFRDYAETTPWPCGHQRHLHDAAGFSEFLQTHTPDKTVKSECNWIEFRAGNGRFAIKFVPDLLLDGNERCGIQFLYRNSQGHAKQSSMSLTAIGYRRS